MPQCDPKDGTQLASQWDTGGEDKGVIEEIPVESRADYHPWFLKNEYILDKTKVVPDHVHDMVMRAWQYAGEGSADIYSGASRTLGQKKNVKIYRLALSTM